MNIVDSNSNFRCLHIKCGERLALEPNVMTYFSLLYALKKSLTLITFKLWKYVKLNQILGHFADHLLKYLRSFEIPWEFQISFQKVQLSVKPVMHLLNVSDTPERVKPVFPLEETYNNHLVQLQG